MDYANFDIDFQIHTEQLKLISLLILIILIKIGFDVLAKILVM